ncbi:hypothetical protein FPV67DRAFT_1450224 [Lyophyllum atratum]|nr:hypothetical protein FPV67DRAFT_1450224 [Lyophyllum atratum]
MTFSGPALRNRLHRTPNYIAKSGWTTTVGWRHEGTDLLLKIMSTKTVDRILQSASFRFNVLAKAKFQLTLERPSDPDFAQDWEPVIRALEHAQNTIANSSEKRYMILREGNMPNDDDIHLWPVSASDQDALHAIVDTHRVLPIVYDENENYVPPHEVPAKLRGLVEIHCRFKHYHIRPSDPSEQPFDSFSAMIGQIIIHKKLTPKNPSPYRQSFKRGRGPYRPRADDGPSRSEQVMAANTFLASGPSSSSSAPSEHSSIPESNEKAIDEHSPHTSLSGTSPSSASTLSATDETETLPSAREDGKGKRKADESMGSQTRKRNTRSHT